MFEMLLLPFIQEADLPGQPSQGEELTIAAANLGGKRASSLANTFDLDLSVAGGPEKRDPLCLAPEFPFVFKCHVTCSPGPNSRWVREVTGFLIVSLTFIDRRSWVSLCVLTTDGAQVFSRERFLLLLDCAQKQRAEWPATLGPRKLLFADSVLSEFPRLRGSLCSDVLILFQLLALTTKGDESVHPIV